MAILNMTHYKNVAIHSRFTDDRWMFIFSNIQHTYVHIKNMHGTVDSVLLYFGTPKQEEV